MSTALVASGFGSDGGGLFRLTADGFERLDAMLADARPGVQALTKQTIPEVGQLVRDLRDTTAALRSITTRVDQQGAASILGSPKLPDYEPSK